MAVITINDKKFEKVEIDVAQDYDDSGNMTTHYVELSVHDPTFKHGRHYNIKIEGKNGETGEKTVLELNNFKFLKVSSSGRFFSPETFARSTMDMVVKAKETKLNVSTSK